MGTWGPSIFEIWHYQWLLPGAGSESEQAIVHSAPWAFLLLSDMKPSESFSSNEVDLRGPFLLQNLESTSRCMQCKLVHLHTSKYIIAVWILLNYFGGSLFTTLANNMCTVQGVQKVTQRMLLEPRYTGSMTSSRHPFKPDLDEPVSGNCFFLVVSYKK